MTGYNYDIFQYGQIEFNFTLYYAMRHNGIVQSSSGVRRNTVTKGHGATSRQGSTTSLASRSVHRMVVVRSYIYILNLPR